ncbi:MAG: hypothetical protein LBU77_01020, partial [Clostridiales bacterium]|nr:hypothetical protein [Clostridiales bacterium]
MKVKKMIAAAITLVMLFGNTVVLYAKDIPEHYSKFTETGVYDLYGFEHYSLAFRLKAGEIYKVPCRLTDGTSLTFYYVCDG